MIGGFTMMGICSAGITLALILQVCAQSSPLNVSICTVVTILLLWVCFNSHCKENCKCEKRPYECYRLKINANPNV